MLTDSSYQSRPFSLVVREHSCDGQGIPDVADNPTCYTNVVLSHPHRV